MLCNSVVKIYYQIIGNKTVASLKKKTLKNEQFLYCRIWKTEACAILPRGETVPITF